MKNENPVSASFVFSFLSLPFSFLSFPSSFFPSPFLILNF